MSNVISPPATPEQLNHTARVLHEYLWARGGLASLFSKPCLDLLREIQIIIPPAPTPAQLGSVHAGSAEHLLGLMTTPPKRVFVFTSESIALGVDVRDIVKEEIGHAMHFDHDLRPARIPVLARADGALVCRGPHDLGGKPQGAAALEVLDDPPIHDARYCPVCHATEQAAHAVFLNEYARETTWLTAQPGEVPLGIGGTVPVMRRAIACAQFDLTRANNAGMLERQQGELRNACRLLDAAQAALRGILDRNQIAAAYEPMRKAAWACAVLTHSHFVHKLHGNDPALAISDLALIKAFSPA